MARSRIVCQNIEPEPIGVSSNEYPLDHHPQKSTSGALARNCYRNALETHIAMSIIEVADNSECRALSGRIRPEQIRVIGSFQCYTRPMRRPENRRER